MIKLHGMKNIKLIEASDLLIYPTLNLLYYVNRLAHSVKWLVDNICSIPDTFGMIVVFVVMSRWYVFFIQHAA
jgi:hypothetical protein